MVSLDRDRLISIFKRKGFTTEEGRTHTLLYFDLGGGRKPPFKTQLQRGSHGRSIPDHLVLKIAAQLGLTKDGLLAFYDCPNQKEDYIPLTKQRMGQDPLDLLK